MYKSEIRPSQIQKLLEKSRKLHYEQYLYKVGLVKCRAFVNQTITFDFPVTALIGPNGGGKTTILGACALTYDSVSPRQFFTRNRQLDQEMKNWSITYDLVDRSKNKTDVVKRTASFSREKWYRDAVHRDVRFFGISRTLPAVERKDLSRFTNKNVVFSSDKIHTLSPEAASHISKILGKDVSDYSVIQTDKFGNLTLLSGKTESGTSYSEFHFGAGESSIIKMVIGIENISDQGLVLIEEIENGLHPLATARLVDYLIDVANRKNVQVIFTTHSEYAIAPLPAEAVWAAVDGTAIQGKLDIHSLRSLTGNVSSKLVIYTEDSFAKKWVEAILRSDKAVAMDAINVYPMNGDGTAVKANKYHNLDPSNKVKSICIIDGDSKQKDDPSEGVFRLPGEAPELYVFDEVVDKIDTCSGMLAVRFMREFTDAPEIKQTILAISKTNRDHHLIFSQIGEAVGFVDESVIVNAFLLTWCSHYKDEVTALLDKIKNQLPLLENEHL